MNKLRGLHIFPAADQQPAECEGQELGGKEDRWGLTFRMSCLRKRSMNARRETISFWVGLGPSAVGAREISRKVRAKTRILPPPKKHTTNTPSSSSLFFTVESVMRASVLW